MQFNQWKIVCGICGKEFFGDNEQRPVNDLIVHHQDHHKSKYLNTEELEAENIY